MANTIPNSTSNRGHLSHGSNEPSTRKFIDQQRSSGHEAHWTAPIVKFTCLGYCVLCIIHFDVLSLYMTSQNLHLCVCRQIIAGQNIFLMLRSCHTSFIQIMTLNGMHCVKTCIIFKKVHNIWQCQHEYYLSWPAHLYRQILTSNIYHGHSLEWVLHSTW